MNRNTIPFDERPPTVASGLRVGTPAPTIRGFDEDDFREVGRLMCEALEGGADLGALAGRAVALRAAAAVPRQERLPDLRLRGARCT